MDRFLQKEALLEQSKNLNTTHMFLNKDKTELIAFVSICNDCIPLELDEKEGYGFTYATIPSLKVARLAINSKFQGRKFYNTIFQYVIYQALTIRNYAGLVFITLDCFKHRKSFYMKKLGFIENKKQNFTKAFDPPTSMRISIDDYLETIV